MIDWSKTAIIFPGQGSQQVGMGAEVAQRFNEARAVFEKSDEILNTAFSKLLFEGPVEELNLTYNTQPAMYVTSQAVLAALRMAIDDDIRPAMLAGHSLGEFTSLVVADALDYDAGLRLVRERARLMQVAGDKHPGAMAAILGLALSIIEDVCQQATATTQKPVVVANDNCPGQVVISGDREALDLAVTLAKEAGAKRTLPLAVSVAAHSPLMEPSAQIFRETILRQTTFRNPKLPVIGNANADFLPDVATIRRELAIQITSPVRWTETMRRMLDNGVTTFLEIGSKGVLSGLMKRIDRTATAIVIEKSEDFHKLAR